MSTAPAKNAGVDRIADAFGASGKRAALMPYLMGGFPTLDESRAIGHACADAGADLVELGVPFSDPLADGPVIQAAGTRALAGVGERGGDPLDARVRSRRRAHHERASTSARSLSPRPERQTRSSAESLGTCIA